MTRANYTGILKPLSDKKICKYDFVGFDVETYGDDNKFYLGGLYYYTKNKQIKYEYFKDKIKMIEFILSDKFKGKFIVATNLGFDFVSLFYNTKYWNDLEILERGSNIIFTMYKFEDGKKIRFIDTMNYAPFSVEKLGNILKIPKLDKPKFLGEKPKDDIEEEELIIYNKRDCEISFLFMYYLQEGISLVGGNLKITIASTSFDVWRRKFLKTHLAKEEKILRDESITDFIFEGYYGGRTEVYKKGEFKDLYYYDINSLYPSVMLNKFPLPQSVRNVPKLSKIYIDYEGVTDCLIECPKMDKPFLPYRNKDKKLIFPYGKFRGTWNNNEIRYALKLGYKILKIYKQVIYTDYFYPFKEFVEYFYNERLKYKNNNSSMELVMKLILNSLYGKFGQKKVKEFRLIDTENYKGTYDELCIEIGNDYTLKDDKVIISKEKKYTGKNVYPILASYVTSYARIKMYEYIKDEDVVYTDTDSVFITSPKYENSKDLGKMKIEDEIKYAYFVKPKFYYTINKEGKSNVKIKGINRADEKDFFKIINGESVDKMKFTKLKESIRRSIAPNTKLILKKLLKTDDDKRIWKINKSENILTSEAIELNEN